LARGVAEPVLSLRSLRKRYGALTVTDGVSLELQANHIHAVIGPNGAGKTSLIHQIAGTVASDSGEVWLSGQNVTRLKPHRRALAGLGRVFQITSILPAFSVLENVAVAAQAADGSSFRFIRAAALERSLNEAAMRMLERVGLAARAATPAHRLSHGEKRQLELAVALAPGPRVVLLDEPMAGAGPEEAARLIALLSSLRDRCAILLVEHDMDAVFALADEISVLAEGRIISSGPPAAIRADAAVRAVYLGDDD
jgi:branched-chain amino acid transport system ATP-binding protein